MKREGGDAGDNTQISSQNGQFFLAWKKSWIPSDAAEAERKDSMRST